VDKLSDQAQHLSELSDLKETYPSIVDGI